VIILLLGSGGREHALAWKMAQSPLVREIVALPGSDGMAALTKVRCIPGNPADIATVLAAARENNPALVVVGPEKPLEAGVVDALEKAGFFVPAPSQAAARLETSKIFSKKFMVEQGIPTALFSICYSYDEAASALAAWDIEKAGIVLKADGLAAGKGVVVTHDRHEALKTAHDFMLNPACSVKSSRLLLEEKMTGKEVSAFALCDGDTFIPLGYACDYKRVGDGDEGPNTGGMGGYAPEGWPSEAARKFINEKIFKRVVEGMKKNGMPFKGFLFAGLMIDGDDVKVIEFNTRFGDPEAQILLPLIADDLVPLLEAAAKGRLETIKTVAFKALSSIHVVMVSEGYPETFGTGMRLGEEITLPQDLGADALVFIAGAKRQNGAWVNDGGRVLGVTALGPTIESARARAYDVIGSTHFDGAHWRKDIGR
jgi:phosphoribosylamine--glycine ligase